LFRQKTSLNNQLSAPSDAIPGWRRPRCVGSALSRTERSGRAAQFDRRSVRAGARAIPAYKFRWWFAKEFPGCGEFARPNGKFQGLARSGAPWRRAAPPYPLLSPLVIRPRKHDLFERIHDLECAQRGEARDVL
jgi:hypothetical protein